MTHRKATAWILGLCFLASTALADEPQFEKADGSTLVYKVEGKTVSLKTGVPDPRPIGTLKHESGLTYVLFQGRACDRCSEEQLGVFLMRLDGKGKPFQFVYPGRITDPKRGQRVYEGRSFYGHCLPKVKSGLVTHQREVVDRRRGMQKSVFVATPGANTVEEQLIERRLPGIDQTLHLVKRKVCWEIPGKNRTVLRKPLDLTPRKGLDDDEEEEDLNDVKNAPESEGEAQPVAPNGT